MAENVVNQEEVTQTSAPTGEVAFEDTQAEAAATQAAPTSFENFDDEAEALREQEERDAKAEADKQLPPDPNALLEVRHLKKYFVLKKTLFPVLCILLSKMCLFLWHCRSVISLSLRIIRRVL